MTSPEQDLRAALERAIGYPIDWDNVRPDPPIDNPPEADEFVSEGDAARWQHEADSRTVDVFGGGR